MNRARRFAAAALSATLVLSGTLSASSCQQSDVSSCTPERVTFDVHVGSVQSDGSVSVYGSIQFGDSDAGTELTVRAVYVAGQAVTLGPNNFNFRTWTLSLPDDVLRAYAGGTGQAKIPVAAYLYGGCVAHLSAAEEPIVTVPANDAATSDAEASADAEPRADATSPVDGSAD